MTLNIYAQNGELVIIFNKVRWYHGLRLKLFLAYLLIGFLPLIFFAKTINNSMEKYFLYSREAELKRKATRIADNILEENFIFDESKINQFRNKMFNKSIEESFRILVIDNKGIVLQDTNSTENGKTFLAPEVLDSLSLRSISNLQKDKITIYTSAPILNEKSEAIGVVLLVSSVEDLSNLLDVIKGKLSVLNIITSIVVLIGVFFVSKLIVEPLNKLLKVVNMMSEGHLDQRVKVTGYDEFSRLCRAFNKMNDKLEEVEHNREEFVLNVSHELKTPLSSIKVLSESILLEESVKEETYKEFLRDINSEVDRMTFIVNDLLTLVRLNRNAECLNIEEISLNKLIEDIIKRLKPIAKKNDINLIYSEEKNITIEADEVKLSLALSNLVENGIKYTPPGGDVKVIINSDNQDAFITVKDTGIGIAEEEQSKVFNRFYRVDKTRYRGTGGTGLGLAITHSTVLLHNGSIQLNSKEEEGTTFIVRIPIRCK